MRTNGVVAGRVVKIRPHPGGEHIWLAEVNIRADHQPQIVWGGVPIVEVGSLVPVAGPGAWLPATKDAPKPYKIRPRRYRGVRSEGMLCSLAELGWDSSVTDPVALPKDSVGLSIGVALDNHYVDWKRIIVPMTDLPGSEDYAAPESPKELQTA